MVVLLPSVSNGKAGFELMIDRLSFVDQSDLTRQAGDLIGNKVHHVNANALMEKSEESESPGRAL